MKNGQRRTDRDPRILIVDDDEDLRPVLCRIANGVRRSLIVDWAYDVPSAQACLGSRSYDMVLADYLLGGYGSGLALRSVCLRKQPNVTFAMMSSHPIGDYLRMHCSSGRRVPFMMKPFTIDTCATFLREELAAVGIRGDGVGESSASCD